MSNFYADTAAFYSEQGGILDTITNLTRSASAGLTAYKGGQSPTPSITPVTGGGGIPTWALLAGAGALVYFLVRRKK